MSEFDSLPPEEKLDQNSPNGKQQSDKKNFFSRYGEFRKEHRIISRAAEAAVAAGLLYAARKIGKYGRNGQKPEVPIYRIPEEKWEENDLVSWLGNHPDGIGVIRNDLGRAENVVIEHIQHHNRYDRPWLPKKVNEAKAIIIPGLKDIPGTIIAIRKKLSLPKPPK